MQKEQKEPEVLVELGTASVETRGGEGPLIDWVRWMEHPGLQD